MLDQEQQQKVRLAIRDGDGAGLKGLLDSLGTSLDAHVGPGGETALLYMAERGPLSLLSLVMEERWPFQPHLANKRGETVARRLTARVAGYHVGPREGGEEVLFGWMQFGPRSEDDVYNCLYWLISNRLWNRNQSDLSSLLCRLDEVAEFGWTPDRARHSDGSTLWSLIRVCLDTDIPGDDVWLLVNWLTRCSLANGGADARGWIPSYEVATLLPVPYLERIGDILDFQETDRDGLNLSWAHRDDSEGRRAFYRILDDKWRDFILRRGVDIGQRNRSGGTLLHELASWNDVLDEEAGRHMEWLKQQLAGIVQAGVPIDAVDDGGRSAFGMAVEMDNEAMAEALWAIGADPERGVVDVSSENAGGTNPRKALAGRFWGAELYARMEQWRLSREVMVVDAGARRRRI